MNKYLSIRFALLALSFAVIFLAGCKKTENPVTSVNTITRPPQQNKIIYFNYVDGPNTYEIWMANYDGSGAQQIDIALPANVRISGNTTPKISLDDKKIYFNANLTDGGYAILGSGIYSCNIDGSNVQKLVTGGADGIPAILGTYYAGQQGKILYAMLVNYAEDIWTANVDGTSQQQINITLPNNAYIPTGHPVVISPDEKSFFFTVSLTNSNYYIYSCAINGGNITPVVTGASGYNFIMGDTYSVGQQGKILYVNIKGSGEITTANLDGTGTQQLNITLPYPAAVDVSPPKISPDGKTLFFNASGLNSNEYGFYSCNTDGSNLQQILAPVARADYFFIGEAF